MLKLPPKEILHQPFFKAMEFRKLWGGVGLLTPVPKVLKKKAFRGFFGGVGFLP